MAEKVPALEPEKEEAPAIEGAERTRARRVYIPRSDIYETDDAIVIVADMPGVDENSLDIVLENNVLTIDGYADIPAPEGLSLVYAEYESGDYERKFALSDQIDQENVEANVKDGVLTVTLPKAQPAKARKIAVKSG